MTITIDLDKIDNIQFEDVDFKDYPDFSDAFISSADYDGVPMTDEELDELNSGEHSEWVYEKLMNFIV